ncbi:hypothetical protein [Cytobacillus kochii]|uniref:hypothetical protein n=1 Tax=Cytobacillus kochii TaxID=859143 RepID=UPI0024818BE8|nr:hypothetical protein [Cytobacillus kochii]
MKGFISTMLIMWLGFYLSLSIVFMYTEHFKRESIVMTMIESAKIASITNMDDSSRVKENHVEITKDTFETTFEKLFYKNLNLNIDISNISYQYLSDSEEKIKAVKVTVTDSTGTDFQTVLKENTTYK